MARLPSIPASDVLRALRSFGWSVVRKTGSHYIMTKPGERLSLSVPDHNPVAKGTLRGLIRSAGLTVEEFVAAL
jgi:predicted RNA binding protein YcfA (HicA-like mRNA interferase family)